VFTFRFNGVPRNLMHEMALLRAAELALDRGSKRFAIVRRKETGTYTSGGATLPGFTDFQTELDVLIAPDGASWPEQRTALWRSFDAAQVYGDLADLFGAPPR
jgi:hypothetical protein